MTLKSASCAHLRSVSVLSLALNQTFSSEAERVVEQLSPSKETLISPGFSTDPLHALPTGCPTFSV